MKTKLLKIGLIALAFMFVIAGSSWATNKQQERKHKKQHHKRTYQGDHVKKRFNGAGHWQHGAGQWRHGAGHYYKKRDYRYYHPFLDYRRHHEHRYLRPHPYRYRHRHYRRHHRRLDHHQSNNGAFSIVSVFEPGWGFTFATKQ